MIKQKMMYDLLLFKYQYNIYITFKNELLLKTVKTYTLVLKI